MTGPYRATIAPGIADYSCVWRTEIYNGADRIVVRCTHHDLAAAKNWAEHAMSHLRRDLVTIP